jgi:hypothetical protein
MADKKEKLKALKEAWFEFKKSADEISAEQIKDFEETLARLDDAEIPIQRKKILDLYA